MGNPVEIGLQSGNPALFGDTADNPVDATGKARQRLFGCFGIGGLGIIDDQRAPHMAERLHPVRQTGERAQTAPDCLRIDAQSPHSHDCRRRILGIMDAAQRGDACEIGQNR